MSNSPAKRILRLMLIGLIILVLLICLVCGGALVWLRTSSAENYLAGLLVNTLSEQGIQLEMAELSGPLPERILVKDLRLSDRQGLFLRVDELEVRLSLAALLSRTLRIKEVNIKGPRFLRPPDLPEEAAGQVRSWAETLGFTLVLPLKVRLDSLRLEKAVIPWSLLGFEAVDDSGPRSEGAVDGLSAARAAEPERSAINGKSARETFIRLREHPLLLDLQANGALSGGIVDAAFKLRLYDGADICLTAASETLKFAKPGPEEGTFAAKLELDFLIDGQAQNFILDSQIAQERALLTVRKLNLQGPGLALQADGALDLDSLTPSGVLALQGAEHAPWQGLLADFSGLDPALIKGLADPLDIKVDVRSDESGQYVFHLQKLQAGVLGGSGRLTFAHRVGNVPPDAEDTLNADLELTVAELNALLAELSGPAQLKLAVKGTLENFAATILLDSPALSTQAGDLRKVTAKITAEAAQAHDGAWSAAGLLSAAALTAPGGPFDMDASWDISVPAGGGPDKMITVAARKLQAQVFGLALKADLAVGIGGDFNTPAADDGAVFLWPHGVRADGSATAEVKDWTALAALLGTDFQAGKTAASLKVANNSGEQNLQLDLTMSELALSDAAEFNMRDIQAKIEGQFKGPLQRLELAVNSGSGQAGQFAWSQAGLRSSAKDGRGSISLAVKDRAGKSSADLLSMSGIYDLAERSLRLDAFSFQETRLKIGCKLLQPARFNFADGVRLDGLELAFTPSGVLSADFSMKQNALKAEAQLRDLPLELINRLSDSALPKGRIQAELNLSSASEGTLTAALTLEKNAKGQLLLGAEKAAAPSGVPDARLQAQLGRFAGRLQVRGSVEFAVAPQSVPVDGDYAGPPLTFSIPMSLGSGSFPAPDRGGPLHASLRWAGQIAPLWALLPMPGRDFRGVAEVDLSLNGTLERPKFDGQLFLAKARYQDEVLGILLADIDMAAKAAASDGLDVLLSATDGGQGTLKLEGSVRPDRPETLSLRGQMLHLSPVHRDDLNLVASGLFKLHGPLLSPAIEADILLEQGEVLLLSTLGGGSVTTLDISQSDAEPVSRDTGPTCQISIDIPRRFFVRGHDLDSEWQGNLQVSGPVSEPSLTGVLKPVRGTFELLSKTFVFSGGAITFAGGSKLNPGINLELTHSNPSVEALIKVGGSLDRPTLTMESRPPMPQDEVLAHVLFGKNVSDLSRFEVLQLANGLRELAGIGEGGGLDVLTDMRKKIGLDVLRIGSTSDSQQKRYASGMSGADNLPGYNQMSSSSEDEGVPTIEAGKYISDSIYVGVEQGLTQEDTAVRVEIELWPNVMLQGRTSPQSSQAGIGWKMDY